jgi:TRAP-type C4-dicarboxylate transport system permease small subunit
MQKTHSRSDNKNRCQQVKKRITEMKSNSAQFAPRAKKLVERLSHWALALGMGWIMVMMFLITLDVAGRYFFTKPVPGGIEMSEFMLAVFGILGMAYTHMAGGNVKVTMFTRALPARLKYLAETLSHLLSLQIIFFLSLYGIVPEWTNTLPERPRTPWPFPSTPSIFY